MASTQRREEIKRAILITADRSSAEYSRTFSNFVHEIGQDEMRKIIREIAQGI